MSLPLPTPSVSAVVVNWNGGDDVLECLASLQHQARPPEQIVVVDNASGDGSREAISGRFPAVRLLENPRNLGFGPAVNRGVEVASGHWIALINSDAVADERWLQGLLEAVHRPDTGMVAGKIFLDRGRRLLDKVGHRIARDGQNFGRGHARTDDGHFDTLREVAWPDGCAGLWRRDVFEQVGGVDEQFFAYADDADLGIRYRLAGWRCALAPKAWVEHRHSRSLGAYSARKLYLVERNRIWLALKYFPWPLLALNPLLWSWRVLLTLRAQRRGQGPWSRVAQGSRAQVARAIAKAQVDGWLGAPDQLRKRTELRDRCSPDWPRRMRELLREGHLPLADLAQGRVD